MVLRRTAAERPSRRGNARGARRRRRGGVERREAAGRVGGRANHLLVTGRTGTGLTQVLVPSDAPGVSITPMRTVDLTRRFSVVSFDNVRSGHGGRGGSARAMHRSSVSSSWRWCSSTPSLSGNAGRVRHDRRVVVRPVLVRSSVGSYQALKHRFADMKSWLEQATPSATRRPQQWPPVHHRRPNW